MNRYFRLNIELLEININRIHVDNLALRTFFSNSETGPKVNCPYFLNIVKVNKYG